MPVAALPTDREAIADGFAGPAYQRRRDVLRETLAALGDGRFPTGFHSIADRNLARWKSAASPSKAEPSVAVIPGDWGAVTQALTRRHGACFAVLNMANAYYPGGAYGEGAPAQEENMFRRTDCHFRVDPSALNADGRTYRAEMTRLLQGLEGKVYLDAAEPRVCIRGPERRDRDDLGYDWLADDDIFPFFELRASAQDLRDGSAFDVAQARRRIHAIFDTLNAAGLRHVVLGAIGCGAFENPPKAVARLFREAIEHHAREFEVIAFAIHHAGYGRDNYTPFSAALSELT